MAEWWENDPVIADTAPPLADGPQVAGPGGGNWWDADPVIAKFDPGRFKIEDGRQFERSMTVPLAAEGDRRAKGNRRRVGAGGAAALGFGNWAGMGFADEAVAGLQTGADYLLGDLEEGESLPTRYSRRKKRYEQLSDDAWQDHPGAYAAGAIPGFVASAVLTPTLRASQVLNASGKLLAGAPRAALERLAIRRAATEGALSTGATTGALWGGISGFGEGDSLDERLANAGLGLGLGGIGGGILGKVADDVGSRMSRRAVQEIADEGVANAAQREAGQHGITLTRGQASGDVATQATENSMRTAGYGDPATRIAQEATERQRGQMAAASDDINTRIAGVDPSTGLPRAVINQPDEAGTLLKGAIEREAVAGQAALDAANAGDVNTAKAVDDLIQQQLGKGQQLVDSDVSTGARVKEGIARAKEDSGNIRDAAYKAAADLPTSLRREGIEGMSDRIRHNITYNRERPAVVTKDTTNALEALRMIDDVAEFRGPNNLADPAGMPRAEDIVAISPAGIENVRQRLVQLARAANGKARTGDSSDAVAMRAIMEEFDNQLEQIRIKGLFDGDDRWFEAYKAARALHSQHMRKFRPDDALKSAMRDIVEKDATPEQVANYLYGGTKLGQSRTSAHLAEHLKGVLGKDSEEFAAIKQRGWQRLLAVDGQIDHDSALKVAKRIDEFLTDKGSTLAKTLYDDAERQTMARYAQGLRNMSTSKRTPGPALEQMLKIGGKNAQPTELARMLVGGSGNKVLQNGDSGRLVESLKEVFGADSDEVRAVAQAVWRQLTDVPEGTTPKGAQQMATAISALVNGPGRPTAEKLFSFAPGLLDEMGAYANTLRRIAGSADAKNPPNTGSRVSKLVSEQGRMILGALGMVSGGVDGGVSAFLSAQGASMVRDHVAASNARRLFGGSKAHSLSRGIEDGSGELALGLARKGRRLPGPAAGQIGYFGTGVAADEDER